MAVFSVIGGLDRIFGNRLGLGTAYENGIKTIGTLALSMIGIMVLSPVIADICTPVIKPVFQLLGADPSVFAGSLLACDMGGAQLAMDLSSNTSAARFSGILIGSTLGTTISFTVPVSMSSLSATDKECAAKGILCGIITIPIGIVLGGITAGFPFLMIIRNTVPVIILSSLIVLGLCKAEHVLIKAFEIFGIIVTALSTVGIVCAGVNLITGVVIIPNLGSISDAFVTVGEIGIVLSGAFPLIVILKRILRKPINMLSHCLNTNSASIAGIIATLANSIATFDMIKDMDERGKVINMAFAVSAAFVFGDHLAFTAGFDAHMIPALIVCKLSAGFLSIVVALLICRKQA